MFTIRKIAKTFFIFIVVLSLALSFVLIHLYRSLPSSEEILTLDYIEPTQIFSQDGVLIGEIGVTKRYPLDIHQIPPLLQSAFVAVEDIRFYQHQGVDLKALLRASVAVVGAGKKVQGGSTITMQVARNFYLDREKTYLRKIKEILLALKIERTLTKNKILELYLNKIFLGHNSYGVEAASRTYFGKSLKDLTLGEIATLAGLPKAPSTLNPLSSLSKAQKRRNIVLAKMLEHEFIDQSTFVEASQEILWAEFHPRKIPLPLFHVTQLVKEHLESTLPKSVWSTNAKIVTTIDSRAQVKAQEALDRGLEQYDQRHSYRALELNKKQLEQWGQKVTPKAPFFLAKILKKSPESLTVQEVLSTDSFGRTFDLDVSSLDQIRFRRKNSLHLGPYEKDFSKFKEGSFVLIDKINKKIRQFPTITGAQVTIDQDGSILSLVSGLSYDPHQVNRAIHIKRQIGSTFKPFVYASAFSKDYQLETLIQDSAMIYEDRLGNRWTPQNDNKDYKGSISLEDSFILSRNLSTLSLGQNIALKDLQLKLSEILKTHLSQDLSAVLGTNELSPLQLAIAYQCFTQQEKISTKPRLITSVLIKDKEYWPGHKFDFVAQPFSAQERFMTRYLLKEAAKHYKVSGNDIGGKTGTTNDQQDLWFAGFKGNKTSVVWMGCDKPTPLYEYAYHNSLRVWVDALKDLNPEEKESIPEGIAFTLNEKGEGRPFIKNSSSKL